jgi:dynein intermediate chain 2
MEVAYEYTKRRAEFGRPCNFSNGETQILESILPTDAYDDYYIQRNPTSTLVDTTPNYSETEVNTERVVMKSTSMQHIEGGWPKDVDFTEQSDVKRFRKKVEKDEDYQYAMKTLIPRVQRCMKQNNTVNIYEEYFEGLETDHCSEPPFAKGLAVFRDPSSVSRTATSVDWHPEGSSNGRLAVSYAVLNFQDERLKNPNMSTSVSHFRFPARQSRLSHYNQMVANSIIIDHSSTFTSCKVLHLGHYQFQQACRRIRPTISTMLSTVQPKKFRHSRWWVCQWNNRLL